MRPLPSLARRLPGPRVLAGPGTFLLGFVGVLSFALPGQGPVGDPTLPPRGLTVETVDVGQGSSNILIGPTGIAMVFDGGFESRGKNHVLPALRRLGVRSLAFALCSHYDADHIGGLDEVISGLPTLAVWDRGVAGAPTTTAYQNYVRAAGTRRRTLAMGQVFDLGGGAKVTVKAMNGKVGSTTYNLSGTSQIENARSVVLKVEYGNFSMWMGGDLTGGGNSTFDMESRVAAAVGDVDVYLVNHHGSNTSSNATMLARLQPEVSIASAGAGNSYGHPTTGVTNRINPKTSSSLFIATSRGARSNLGHAVSGGDLNLTTDGYRYRIANRAGRFFDLYTDEVPTTTPPAGTLRISELHRNPSKTDGEYLELYCQGPGPVNLRGLTVTGNLGSFTLRTPYRMIPGDYLLFQMQGDVARNGGLPLAHCLPYRAIQFGNSFDTIRVRLGTVEQDRLSYSSLAGGSGIAAERIRLNTSTTSSNFTAATRFYGPTDRGTPGLPNTGDKTAYGAIAAMEVLPASAPGSRALHMITHAPAFGAKRHAMLMSLGSSPGMRIGGTFIPLNPDGLFDASLLLPGAIGSLRSDGRRGVRIKVPVVNGLQGLPAYFAQVILDPTGPVPFPAASNAVRFVFP